MKVFEAIDGSNVHNEPAVVTEDVMPAVVPALIPVVVPAIVPAVVPAVVLPIVPPIIPAVNPVVVITTPAEAVAIPDLVESNDVPAVGITPALTTPDGIATNTIPAVIVVTPEATAKAKETDVEPAPVTLEKQPLSQDQSLAVDDYVIAVYGKRWYVARVMDISIEDDEVSLTFMTPIRAKWKWGQRDEGVVDRTCILLKVNPPQKDSSSVFLDIQRDEHLLAQDLYANYKE